MEEPNAVARDQAVILKAQVIDELRPLREELIRSIESIDKAIVGGNLPELSLETWLKLIDAVRASHRGLITLMLTALVVEVQFNKEG